MAKHPKIAVRALIVNKDRQILLLKRSNSDYWCLPGGDVEFGEKVRDALIREVREETNLNTIATFVLLYQDSLPTEVLKSHYVSIYFLCKVTGEIKLNEESSDYAWVGPEDIDKYNIVFLNDDMMRQFWKDFSYKEWSINSEMASILIRRVNK